MPELLRSFGHITERRASAEVDDRTFTFICSTADEDSYGECIDQKSWRTARYLLNPIVLYQHDRGQNHVAEQPSYPIGTASNVRVDGGKLLADITISRATEQAETVYRLLKEGVLRAVSVGFMPGRIVDEKNVGGDVTRTVLYDCELFEISVVMVPANPAAVSLARTKAVAEMRARTIQESPMPEATQAAIAATEAPAVVEAVTAAPAAEPVIEFAPVIVEAPAIVSERAAEIQTPAAPVFDLRELGIGDDAATAAKAVADLRLASAERDALAPRVRQLEAEIDKRDAAEAEREVNWLFARQKDYGLAIDERARKALLVRRKHDAKGFAEDYKAALDGLKAFDSGALFAPITTAGGVASQAPTALAGKTAATDNSDLERAASELQALRARNGSPISRSEALELAIHGTRA